MIRYSCICLVFFIINFYYFFLWFKHFKYNPITNLPLVKRVHIDYKLYIKNNPSSLTINPYHSKLLIFMMRLLLVMNFF